MWQSVPSQLAKENKKVVSEIKSYIKSFIVDDEIDMSGLLDDFRSDDYNEKYEYMLITEICKTGDDCYYYGLRVR